MGEIARLPERSSELATRWASLVADYDRFYADHINQILSEDHECLQKVNKKRRELDDFLEKGADCEITSMEHAADLLALALSQELGDHTTPQSRVAGNVLRYLRDGAPYRA